MDSLYEKWQEFSKLNDKVISDLMQENATLKEENESLKDALVKIRDCATTEMVEISTRKDYDGFLALKGISIKVSKVLKDEVQNV